MKPPPIHELRILTPDGVVFALPLAGPAIRALALFIDLLTIQATLGVVYRLVAAASVVMPDFSYGLMVFIQFATQILYGIVLESIWGGRTLGKRILGLRVADEHGLHLRPSQVALRNLMRPVDALPFGYLVGGLAAFFSRRAQRLGDLVAGTVVIRTPQIFSADGLLEKGKFNSFRAHPAMEARLRQRTDPDEASLLARTLARRDTLDPAARVALFAEIADRFRTKVRFPDEITHSLTDEQYLRNAADSLFRGRT